jgi:amino acid transporter
MSDPEKQIGGALRGRRPGDRRYRVDRPHAPYFRYAGERTFVAREAASMPRTPVGMAVARVRHRIFGKPLSNADEASERLSVATGLPVFASDNISSSAYATEEIMRVLVFAGAGALVLTLPITIVVVVVLAIVVTSYRQTIAAYPKGGGSYIVASDNLGTLPGLAAASAILTDYVLTVAVSTAAGVAALTSIFPELFDYRVVICVTLVVLLAMVNLRGIRESGLIFSAPTYIYLIAIFGLLAIGFFRFATGTMPDYTPPANWLVSQAEPLGWLLILRAFASGSVALTGTEAVADGVPAFKPPEARNAKVVVTIMGASFALIFLGMSFLVGQLGIVPDPSEQETVISQVTRTFVGAGSPYHYLVQLSTAVLLVLAANTSFADFPRLSSFLARDGFLPRVFQFRGDRLAFNSGIILLTSVSVVLLVAFGGSVSALIPLYTVGVFIAFTLSQSGMVRRWFKLRASEKGWRRKAMINGIGAATTAVVAVEVAASKLLLGAWVVLLLIPVLMALMLLIKRQYTSSAEQLAVRADVRLPGPHRDERVVVPVPGINRAVVQALNVARSVAGDVLAVLVTDNPEEAAATRKRWELQLPEVPLVIVESPYRTIVNPLLAYLDVLDEMWPDGKEKPITFVVIPEFVARHWWERLLYNQSANRLRRALLGRPYTVVVNVPFRREDHLHSPA